MEEYGIIVLAVIGLIAIVIHEIRDCAKTWKHKVEEYPLPKR